MGYSPLLWGKEAWHFIHYVALAYIPSEENKNSYMNFFNSLPDTLPCPICGEHFKQNMQKYPPRFDSSNDLFEWTVDMHNLVNRENGKVELTYKEAIYEINKKRAIGAFNSPSFKGLLLSFGIITGIMFLSYAISKKMK